VCIVIVSPAAKRPGLFDVSVRILDRWIRSGCLWSSSPPEPSGRHECLAAKRVTREKRTVPGTYFENTLTPGLRGVQCFKQ